MDFEKEHKTVIPEKVIPAYPSFVAGITIQILQHPQRYIETPAL
jgi:hypothetical protein